MKNIIMIAFLNIIVSECGENNFTGFNINYSIMTIGYDKHAKKIVEEAINYLIAKLSSTNEEIKKAFSTKLVNNEYELITFLNSKKVNDSIQNELKLLDQSERKNCQILLCFFKNTLEGYITAYEIVRGRNLDPFLFL